MPRLPIRLTLEISRTPDDPVGSEPAGAAQETGTSDAASAQGRDLHDVEVDLEWQPLQPRISFLDGDAEVAELALDWLARTEAPGSLAERVAAALDRGEEVTLTLRRRG